LKFRLNAFLFSSLLFLTFVCGFALIKGPDADYLQSGHLRVPGLMVSGTLSRIDLLIGIAFIIGSIGVYIGSISLATLHLSTPKKNTAQKVILVVCLSYLMVLIFMTILAFAGIGKIFLGLPLPTAVMLYAVGLFPLILSVLYILNFDDWVISEKSFKEFQSFLSNYKK
jgi:hypothetical protein